MSNMFAPMAVRLAEMGERDRKALAEQREAERIERLGRVIAEELGPILATAITKAFKDSQPAAQQGGG